MPLKNKYLRYTPEITLEIFALIWDKLKFMFPDSRIYSWKSGTFDSFKTYKFISIWGIHEGSYAFGINNNPGNGNLQEATVEEILGYNPFIKDDFVLPEKWYVRVDDKNLEDIQSFKNKYNWTESAAKYKAVGYEGVGYNNIPSHYTEITFDQFKKYVLKESIEQPKVIEKDWSKATKEELLEEAKRRYPIGCKINSIKGNSKNLTVIKDNFTIHNTGCKIGITVSTDYANGTIVKNGCSIFVDNKWAEIISLPETKVESKEVIPEYVECINIATRNTKIGEIFKCRLRNGNFEWEYNDKSIQDYDSWDGWSEKWGDRNSLRCFKLSTKTAFEAQNQPKQPLEQAVHCTTQEEWDFVCEKLHRRSYCKFREIGDSIFISNPECSYFKDNNPSGISFTSFQEWCDLNGYKMENEVKFEVGKWYYFESYDNRVPNIARCDELKLEVNSFKSNNWIRIRDTRTSGFGAWSCSEMYNSRELSLKEIQQYLISIGQIPVGEPLNTGIEPDKDGMFKYINVNKGSNPLCEFTSISINGEEIYNKNKFNILKTTKTIKF